VNADVHRKKAGPGLDPKPAPLQTGGWAISQLVTQADELETAKGDHNLPLCPAGRPVGSFNPDQLHRGIRIPGGWKG